MVNMDIPYMKSSNIRLAIIIFYVDTPYSHENFDMATMEKFLNADVNNDRKVNVLDASQAVQEMIKRNKQ